MSLDRYFSLDYLVRMGYFDFKPSKGSGNSKNNYFMSNTFYKKVFNCNSVSNKINDILYDVKFNAFIDTIPIEFTIYKSDESRRIYKMPNMYSYISLAKHLETEKKEYIKIIESSDKSLSKYFYDKDFFENKKLRERNRFGMKYIFETDIQEFYPSLYTHSIPWVIVGKEIAKSSKDDKNIFFNKLDSLIQKCQYGETYGIPMGTFASRLISEIYMCKIDDELKKYRYLRYVDDFELAYNNEKQREEFYNYLLNKLKELHLKIKVEKNKIYSFPFKLQENNVDLKNFFNEEKLNLKDDDYQIKKVHAFINLSLEKEQVGVPGALKLMFLILNASIKDKKIKPTTICKTIIERLLNLVLMRPILGGYFLDLIEYAKNEKTIRYLNEVIERNLESFKENIYRYIDLNYGEEMLTILCIFYKLDIYLLDEEILCKVIENMDDFNSIIAIELCEKINHINWERLFNTLELKLKKSDSWQSEFWLLKYELFYKVKNKKSSSFTKEYKNYLYKLYDNGITKSEFFNETNLRKLESNIILEVQNKNTKNNDIRKFYMNMLQANVSFLNCNSKNVNYNFDKLILQTNN